MRSHYIDGHQFDSRYGKEVVFSLTKEGLLLRMPQGRGSGNFLRKRIYIDNKYLGLQSVESKRVRCSCMHTHMYTNISREGTRDRVVQWASLIAQLVKNPPVMQESACNAGDVGSIPGFEDPLEEKIATHSSILAWEITWTEDLGGLQFMESQELDMT